MTVSVSDILDRTSTILQDKTFKRWSQADQVAYLNDGQRKLITIKGDAKVTAESLQLVSGAVQQVPSACYALIDVLTNLDGSVPTPCDRNALDAFSPGWMNKPVASTIKHWMPGDTPSNFFVYPAQGDTPGVVKITYTAYPNTVTYGQNIDVRDHYADNLVSYVLFRCYSRDVEFGGSAEQAIAYYQAFAA